MRIAWHRGAVLCGASAGSMCWFDSGLTDATGTDIVPLHNALGFNPGSNCTHYDSDPRRRPACRQLVADATLPEGYATDDGSALHFEGTKLAAVVCSRRTARAYRVERAGDAAREEPLPSTVL